MTTYVNERGLEFPDGSVQATSANPKATYCDDSGVHFPDGSVQTTAYVPARAAQFNQLSVDQKRAAMYPSVNVFIEAWVKNDTKALEAFRQAYLAVQKKYPKTT